MNSILRADGETHSHIRTLSYCIFIQEEISLKPFKLQDLPQDSRNKKENTQRQAWPHQRLKEMKNKKPKKKQNALLENIGLLTTRTESSTTSMQCKDRPYIEESTVREEFTTRNERKQLPLANSKNVNLHSQDLRSNIVEKNESNKSVQRVVDTDKNIAQAKNVTRDSVSTMVNTIRQKVAEEVSKPPPQSVRSTSSTGNKSKLTSKKPPTKTLHLGKQIR